MVAQATAVTRINRHLELCLPVVIKVDHIFARLSSHQKLISKAVLTDAADIRKDPNAGLERPRIVDDLRHRTPFHMEGGKDTHSPRW